MHREKKNSQQAERDTMLTMLYNQGYENEEGLSEATMTAAVWISELV